MKNFIFSIVIIMMFSSSSFCFSLLGGVKNEIKNLKGSIEKSMSDIQAGVNSNKLGINDVSNAVVKTTAELGVVKDNVANLTATIKLQANAIAGMNNSVSELKAGRDVVQGSNNVNDTGLMSKLFSILSSGYLWVIGLLLGFMKIQSRQLARQNNQVIKLLTDKEQTYKDLVDDNNTMYEKELKSKDDYKIKYFEMVNDLLFKAK